MGRFLDSTGQKFGRWTVIKQNENNNSNRIKWWCICDCQVNEENPTLKPNSFTSLIACSNDSDSIRPSSIRTTVNALFSIFFNFS